MLELGRAAVSLASARIERSDPAVTFYGQEWARPISLSDADFGTLPAEGLKRYRVAALLYDELARVNINSASRGGMKCCPLVDDELASAITDWRDEDDSPSPLGAESAFYRTLTPPISAKNAPFSSVYELLVVKGITPVMFFGADGDTVRVPDTALDWSPPAEGLRDFFTTFGKNRLNINTAGIAALLSIPGVDEQIADNIVYFRSGQDSIERTEDDVAIRGFDQLKAVGALTEFAIRQIAARCVVTSDFFGVRVEVIDGLSSAKVHLDAVFERTKDETKCISWRER
jgi:hypothetical protein